MSMRIIELFGGNPEGRSTVSIPASTPNTQGRPSSPVQPTLRSQAVAPLDGFYPTPRNGHRFPLSLGSARLHRWWSAVKAVGVKADDRPGVLVLGSGTLADGIMAQLQSRPNFHYRLVGSFNIPSKVNGNGHGNGHFTHLEEILSRERVGCIAVAMSERRGTLPIEQLLAFKMRGIKVEDGAAFFEKISGMIPVDGLNPGSLIFSEGFNRLRLTMLCKRAVDVAVSLTSLILALPVFIVLPLAIRFDSKGPALYRHNRIGQHGKIFKLLKFRSMRWEPDSQSDSRWAQENDSRLTRVGKAIRRWRLDELPQLWNVLRGDMSFVGPRPDVLPLHDTLQGHAPYYTLRTTVKPGITGWAQVRYHYVSSIEEGIRRHEYDLYYLKNLSLRLDVRIIIETLKIVLLGKGAR